MIFEDYRIIAIKNNQKKIIDICYVDSVDYNKINKFKWRINSSDKNKKYLMTTFSKGNRSIEIKMHHLIFGKPPKGYVIDHIDGNSLNNKKNNLRIATFGQNSQNRSKFRTKEFSSKYIGVNKRGKVWEITCGGKYYGKYKTEQEAANVYNLVAKEKYGKDCKLNEVEFIDCKIKETRKNKNKGYVNRKGRYTVRFNFNNVKYNLGTYTTKQEAIEVYKTKLSELKDLEEKEHMNKPITKNEEGIAYIKINNKGTVKYCYVDDEDWHLMSKVGWT